MIAAHTHTAYICRIKNSVKAVRFPVTEASAFGRVITDIDITLWDAVSGRAMKPSLQAMCW